jgi:hypothetical protein
MGARRLLEAAFVLLGIAINLPAVQPRDMPLLQRPRYSDTS